ncbi:Arc family DNA-binding protein [Fertoebacter nigrum]|uniref:Arc family DNA-binding protein n=1 Tax=Fertoeibacter niger TaxID=2656921 RepID=A0A8X8GZW0_9RHOB|nr:Arc family DNA-binding protein [Fertoeibacter niger]NUB42863.1 Arc family DNA-binding protein [Fertoeibacter niger]
MATCQHEAIMTERKPLQLRLPPDLKAWLKAEAEKNGASQNSEVIRAIRAAMDRTDLQPTT